MPNRAHSGGGGSHSFDIKTTETQTSKSNRSSKENYANLISIPTLVESPFIYVTIGKYTFGLPTKTKTGDGGMIVDYPNFMNSLTVVKVNGEVNTYQLRMTYQIKQGDDPNLIDNILSSISSTRIITISYGDWCSPGNIYKEEEVLITNVKSNIEFSQSRISYDIAGVSKALNLMSQITNFPAPGPAVEKPSNILIRMINDPRYGISKNFSGMSNLKKVLQKNLIASDDKPVKIEAKNHISVYEYINYLVDCMIPNNTAGTTGKAYYALSIIDDNKNEMGGSYFKITKIGDSETAYDNKNAYVLDVGYPENNFITNFSLKDNETWSILFDSSNNSQYNNFTYHYDADGVLIKSDSPSVTRSKEHLLTTAEEKAWWTKMTEFPISATITFKGLVRPTMLVSYVKINTYFFGRKYVASGTYIITKQTDTISANGYQTTLELQRIKGE